MRAGSSTLDARTVTTSIVALPTERGRSRRRNSSTNNPQSSNAPSLFSATPPCTTSGAPTLNRAKEMSRTP